MNILEALKDKSANETEFHIYTDLLGLANKVIDDVKGHLSLIRSQLPDFDEHDCSHSEKVLRNMESLLGDKILKLSGYELFLLYMSAYLHDCGMARPEWEIKVLSRTEGFDSIDSLELDNSLKRDLLPPFKLSQAMEIIKDPNSPLFVDYKHAKGFIFVKANDEHYFRRELCRELMEYQNFRNGYALELKVRINNIQSYVEFSKYIRREYFRMNHPIKSEQNILNMSPLFAEKLNGPWGEAIAKDLSQICRSHGESFDYVRGLCNSMTYLGPDTANLQFIATILRLADSLHFSYDRAPESLFAEKVILDDESIKHWSAKAKGVNYSFIKTEIGTVKIVFSAYCDDPGSYYFIHDYLDVVDEEVNNYFRFLQTIDSSADNHQRELYRIPLEDKVDRSKIRYDQAKFTPVQNMKFVLNQNRIIELLMGVGLYKQKWLCLRELYQNSLDACRSMVSSFQSRKISQKGYIEFGLGECLMNGKTRKYIYCQDNGIGMTEEIVLKYFLQIGNSYYNSREFQRRSIKWGSSFTACSQFGIGILSCFMIGDILEITSISMNDNNEESNVISFLINGPHESFFFVAPDELISEQIGPHGTLVKLYLNEDEAQKLKCEAIDEKQVWKQNIHPYSNDSKYLDHENNLSMKVNSIICIEDERVETNIKLSDGQLQKLVPSTKEINFMEFSEDELSKLELDSYHYVYRQYKNSYSMPNCIENKIISSKLEGVEIHIMLPLPRKNAPSFYHQLNYPEMIGKAKILVDGIFVEKIDRYSDYRFPAESIVNFTGALRPTLSIDRCNVTEWPEPVRALVDSLLDKMVEKIVFAVNDHFSSAGFSSESEWAKEVWEYLFSTYKVKWLLLKHAMTFKLDIHFRQWIDQLPSDMSLLNFVSTTDLIIKYKASNDYEKFTNDLIIAKMGLANTLAINDDTVFLVSNENSIQLFESMYRFSISNRRQILVKVDSWDGLYKEYDLVSHLWPLVPSRFFDRIPADEWKVNASSDSRVRERKIETFYEPKDIQDFLCNMGGIDSKLIHPYGSAFVPAVFLNEDYNYYDDFCKFSCKICKSLENEHLHIFFYVYISPSILTEEDKDYLDYYHDKDPVYVEGLVNGWSILIVGQTGESIILPGIVSRNEVLKEVRSSFWEEYRDNFFIFLDGSPVVPPTSEG